MCNEEIIKHMEEDMTFRGLSEKTMKSYILRVKRYMDFHKGKNIEELTEDDIRDFLKYLVEECKNKRRDVNTFNSAIRFMYGTTLNKVLNLKRIPLFKLKKNKPEMFTKDELKKFFEACDDERQGLKYKALFMTAYGGGLRASEVVSLRIQDIDSKNMRILVREGKESKYRYTLLSQTNLDILREYYKTYQPRHPENYLFLAVKNNDHFSISGLEIAFRKIRKKIGVTRKITVHGLRHNFATDLIENGLDILHLQKLLGHSGIRSTMEYLHLANVEKDIVSPLDRVDKSGDENA